MKIYIYNLSSEFNKDISNCIHSHDDCFDYSNHGIGELLYQQGQIAIHNTHQFSLDIILHHQFAHSRYRTNNPWDADIFYVPAYMGSLNQCPKQQNRTGEIITRVFQYLNTMPYFRQKKPHLTSLSKIEREQVNIVLSHPSWENLTYMTIEKDISYFRSQFGIESMRAIVVPYPSYIHFTDIKTDSAYDEFILKHNRSVFLFLAASLRRSNPFRAKLLDQFTIKTKLSFNEFMKSRTNSNIDRTNGNHSNSDHPKSDHQNIDYFNSNHPKSDNLHSNHTNSDHVHNNDAENGQIMLVTWECMGDHHNTTIEWMLNSVFCLQPHGDSPTRKSFYDSILSGCIPVIFKFPYEDIEFPFQRSLNYSNFVVQIPVNNTGHLKTNIPIYEYLRKIPQTEIKRLQKHLAEVIYLFQYPVISREQKGHKKDAVDMIVDEIRAMYNL